MLELYRFSRTTRLPPTSVKDWLILMDYQYTNLESSTNNLVQKRECFKRQKQQEDIKILEASCVLVDDTDNSPQPPPPLQSSPVPDPKAHTLKDSQRERESNILNYKNNLKKRNL